MARLLTSRIKKCRNWYEVRTLLGQPAEFNYINITAAWAKLSQCATYPAAASERETFCQFLHHMEQCTLAVLGDLGPLEITSVLCGVSRAPGIPASKLLAAIWGHGEQFIPSLTSKQVSLWMWSLGKTGHLVCEEVWEKLLQRSYDLLEDYNPQDCSNSLWGVTQAGRMPPLLWLRRFWLESESRLCLATPQALLNIVQSVAQLQVQPPPSWLDTFMEQTYLVLPHMGGRALAGIPGAMVKLGWQPSQEWVQKWMNAVAAGLADLSPEDTCMCLVAAANYRWTGDREWVHNLVDRFCRTLSQNGANLVAKVFWATAVMDMQLQPGVFRVLLKYFAHHVDHFDNIALTQVMWSLRRIPCHLPQSIVKHVALRVRDRMIHMEPRSLSTLMSALAYLGFVPDWQWMLNFYEQSLARLETYNVLDLYLTLWALARMNQRPVKFWMDQCMTTLERSFELTFGHTASAAGSSSSSLHHEREGRNLTASEAQGAAHGPAGSLEDDICIESLFIILIGTLHVLVRLQCVPSPSWQSKVVHQVKIHAAGLSTYQWSLLLSAFYKLKMGPGRQLIRVALRSIQFQLHLGHYGDRWGGGEKQVRALARLVCAIAHLEPRSRTWPYPGSTLLGKEDSSGGPSGWPLECLEAIFRCPDWQSTLGNPWPLFGALALLGCRPSEGFIQHCLSWARAHMEQLPVNQLTHLPKVLGCLKVSPPPSWLRHYLAASLRHLFTMSGKQLAEVMYGTSLCLSGHGVGVRGVHQCAWGRQVAGQEAATKPSTGKASCSRYNMQEQVEARQEVPNDWVGWGSEFNGRVHVPPEGCLSDSWPGLKHRATIDGTPGSPLSCCPGPGSPTYRPPPENYGTNVAISHPAAVPEPHDGHTWDSTSEGQDQSDADDGADATSCVRRWVDAAMIQVEDRWDGLSPRYRGMMMLALRTLGLYAHPDCLTTFIRRTRARSAYLESSKEKAVAYGVLEILEKLASCGKLSVGEDRTFLDGVYPYPVSDAEGAGKPGWGKQVEVDPIQSVHPHGPCHRTAFLHLASPAALSQV